MKKTREYRKKISNLSKNGLSKIWQAWTSFMQTASAGGIILIIWVIVALLLANGGAWEALHELFQTKVGFSIGNFNIQETLKAWIDDGLMAIFFLVVGLEIKREFLNGELSSFKKAILPILAAFGGAIVPALIYLIFNRGTPTESGRGIPMATDIAFALSVIAMLGKRVPLSLKVFLAALAIVDDLIAILVIAFFYSSNLDWTYLLIGLGIFLIQLAFNRAGVKQLRYYVIPGLLLWYCIHHSGIHATIAGVLTAIAIPTIGAVWATRTPVERLEHGLNKFVVFWILPLFAFVNTAIIFKPEMLWGLTSSLGLGIGLGLLLGKTIGIVGTAWLLCKAKIAALPSEANWKHMLGVGLLGGIGFTMSIFVSILSFEQASDIDQAKLAILITSTIAACWGYWRLKNIKKTQ